MLSVDGSREAATGPGAGALYEQISYASVHHSPAIPSHASEFLMADRPYESGRARSSHHPDSSRSRRSPPGVSTSSNAYYPVSGFASHTGRPTLPPLPASNSPARGMPVSSTYATASYRPQSPGRFDDTPSVSHYHSASNTPSTGWPSERQVDSRGVPSQPAWPAYPAQTQYDPRYVGQQQSYYQQSQQLSATETQRRLPPLNIPGLQGQDDAHYLANPGAARSPITAPYSSQSPYSVDSSRSSRYSPPHYSSTSSAQAASRHHSSSYAHTGGAAHSAPFTSTEWGGPIASGSTRHDDPTYGSAPYGYPPQDRESWADLHSPTDSRSEEPLVKKKRKRADANQLRVLNATYQRTAFPSTQERESLAKELDMSPRSVQIWFQNKRQSMRQSRSAANNLPPILHSAYSNTSPTEPKPTHQTYHALSAEASSNRRREGTPSESRRRAG